MNGVATHAFFKLINLSCLQSRFMSSSAIFENQSFRYNRYHMGKLNPVYFLTNPINLRGLNLTETEIVHSLLLKTCMLYSNIIAANNLLDSYSEWGRMKYAFRLFDEIPEPQLVTWNLVVLGCNKNYLFNDSWRIFCQMHKAQVGMDEFSYGSVLSALNVLGRVAYGEMVYGLVMKNGFFSDGYLRAGMVVLFTKRGRIDDALKVLYEIPCENIVCWNAVVSGAVKNNDNRVALEIFSQMCRNASSLPNTFTFSSALTACAALNQLDFGKSIQGWVIKTGEGEDIFVGTSTVDLYAKCGAMSDAMKQFKLMSSRNVVSWTSIISGFVHKGDSDSAVLILKEMQTTGEEMNNYTVSSALAACANPDMFTEAMQIHCWILKIGFCSDSVVKASLITMYSKIGAVNLSELAFAETHNLKQVGIWNNMISAFVQNNNYEKAVVLLQEMLKLGISPDKFSTSSILSVIDCITLGRQLHVYALKIGLLSDVSVGSSTFTMYSKCGNIEDSVKAFEQLEMKDNVAWTSMIAGFAEHGFAEKSLQMFREMQFQELAADELCITAVLTACSSLLSIKLGKQIHGFYVRRGVHIDGSLVNMYSKCGDLNSAKIIFDKMPFKDHVSFSSLVSGLSQRGLIEDAIHLFKNMLLSSISIDDFTFSSILGAISNRLSLGTQLHVHIMKLGIHLEANVGSSLIMMYSKCGNVGDCSKAFHEIKNPDLVTWTTVIASYAHNGKGLEALQMYELLKKSGIKPDEITFVAVLSACNHSGLVEEGYFCLNSMIKEYGIEPDYKHYSCMVDLLGRAGRLEEAVRFIYEMPLEPDNLMWETLLASCKVHGNHEIGRLVYKKIMELKPSEAGAYVSLSNVLADVGDWDSVVEIRGLIEENGVRKKEPGWSFV